jgi:hypothetical protein
VDLYIHSPIRLHGVVLNLLRTGTTLPFIKIIPTFEFVFWDLMPESISDVSENLTRCRLYVLTKHQTTFSLIETGPKMYTHLKKTPWSEPASELYRPSDRRLSAKRLPTFVDKGCHVVSVTDLYGRILGFLDRSRYFSIE